MNATAGFLAVAVAAAAAVVALVAFVRARGGDPRRRQTGTRAVCIMFGAVTVAVVALERALIGVDFSVQYVALNIHSSTPLLFRVIGLWGALEGSILLWAWVLAGYTVLVAVRYRHRHPETTPFALAVLLSIAIFFLLLMLGPANPFVRLDPVPPEGRGLNPLLQNHPLMAIHPPLLYLGYVGFSVPYAFALASLLSRTMRDEWMLATRRWTLAAWSFLGAGIVLGAWWSYEVLGWGGYWAWDPVENAALMPWLGATAFLHSVMVQERRRLLRLWNHALVIVTFLLTIFGTFLTRSGILGSVHDFTQSLIGPIFLGFMTLVLTVSVATLVARRNEVRDTGTLPAVLSRETVFLLNNLVLLAIAATVFIGTMFPLLAEAVAGVKLTVGPPYFNRLIGPLGLLLLLLMAIATLLPWGPLPRDALRRFRWPGAGAVAGTGALALVGVRGPTLLALAVIGFTALAQLTEFHRGAHALMRAERRAYPAALAALFSINRRRYAGYLAHLGLALMLAGVTVSFAYRSERDYLARPGEMIRGPGYLLRYEGSRITQRPDRVVVAAEVAVLAGDALEAAPQGAPAPRILEVLRPSENHYPQQRTPIPTPAVRSSWRGDLYLVLLSVDEDHGAALKIISSPLVTWIWTGGLLMALAGLLSAWPTRRG
ncbi:MAG: heme lyase CcmF/NrfE family subunit [bacterium]